MNIFSENYFLESLKNNDIDFSISISDYLKLNLNKNYNYFIEDKLNDKSKLNYINIHNFNYFNKKINKSNSIFLFLLNYYILNNFFTKDNFIKILENIKSKLSETELNYIGFIIIEHYDLETFLLYTKDNKSIIYNDNKKQPSIENILVSHNKISLENYNSYC